MMNIDQLLGEVVDGYKSILGNDLVGIYLHGSLAFGCFTWERSDVDFIAVVASEPTASQKADLIRLMLRLDKNAPPKGLEMSLVPRSACREFSHPAPYYLHFSNGHKQSYIGDLEGHIALLRGVDRDLAAHFTVIKAVGKVLCGEPIANVFGEVPRRDYIDSLMFDSENAADDILENPVYVILNLCRVLAYLEDAGVMSKRGGGEWGMEHLPKYCDVISPALREYSGGESMNVPKERLVGFADDIMKRIGEHLS